MIKQTKPLDLYAVLWETGMAREYVDKCRLVAEDQLRDERLIAQQCQRCYYLVKAGGAVCTEAKCGLCETMLGSANSCVARLCMDCAKAHRLCSHCGGDMNLKDRRKL